MRTFGHIPDSDFSAPTVRKRFGQARMGAPLASNGVKALIAPYVLDQGEKNKCVGAAMFGAIYVLSKGTIEPSTDAIWLMAKGRDGSSGNEGVRPYSAVAEMQGRGIPTGYKMTEGAMDEVLPASTWMGAAGFAFDAYRINDFGDGKQARVEQALSGGHPVTLAIEADDALVAYTGGVWDGPKGRIHGGHYVMAYAYDADGIWCRNSWGEAWGVKGDFHLGWRYANSFQSTDYYVITYATRKTAA